MQTNSSEVQYEAHSPVADPTPLGNIITGLVLFTLWPVLFGLADTSAMAAILPWALAAAPLVLLTSVQAFKAGNVIGAVANGVLSGVTLVQNGIWGAVVVTPGLRAMWTARRFWRRRSCCCASPLPSSS